MITRKDFTFSILVVLGTIATCVAQYDVSIVSDPPGDGNSGYQISTSLTLSCVINPPPPSPQTVSYQWSSQCMYTGGGVQPCFPSNQATASVTTNRLKAEDSGTFQCSAVINSVTFSTQSLFTVRVTGIALEIDGNPVGNYTFLYENDVPSEIYCKSGLILPFSNRSNLGEWRFNGQPLRNDPDLLNCELEESFITSSPNYDVAPGVLSLSKCLVDYQLYTKTEGVYTCSVMDIDMVVHELEIGIYFNRTGPPTLRGPVLDPPTVTLGQALMIGCLVVGAPPDEYHLSKDGMIISTEYSTFGHSETDDGNFIIQHSINVLTVEDFGIYTCLFSNPILIGNTRSNSKPLNGPLIAPPNFVVTMVISNNLAFSWSLIPGLEAGGLQIGYTISCEPGSHRLDVNGSTSTAEIGGLLAFTMYSCTIFAYSQLVGPVSGSITAMTLEAVPSAPQSFMAVAVSFNTITTSWQPPIQSNGVLTSYVIRYTINNVEQSITVTSNIMQHNISTFKPYQTVQLGVSAATSVGVGLQSNQVEVTTLPTLPGHVSSVQTSTVSSTSSRVQWMAPQAPNGQIASYRLIVTSLVAVIPTETVILNGGLTFTMENLEPGVPYEVLVMAINEIGEGPARGQEFFTEQMGPLTAPQNVVIKNYSLAILVTWNELALSESRGIPIYIVEYQSSSFTKSINTTDAYVVIEDLTPATTYMISVAAATRNGQELLVGPATAMVEAVTAASAAASSDDCSCTAMLGVAVVFVVLFLICLVIVVILTLCMWKTWRRQREENYAQTKLSRNFEFASRENFDLQDKKLETQSTTTKNQSKMSLRPAIQIPADERDPNIYDTIEKHRKRSTKRVADRASTGTKYDTIDKKDPATTTATNADDKSGRYTKAKIPEISGQHNSTITDIYVDAIPDASNTEAPVPDANNRESLNLDMFAPIENQLAWLSANVGAESSVTSAKPEYSVVSEQKKPDDMVSLID